MLAEELKSMNIKQLGELAAKLRGELISGVRAGGGEWALREGDALRLAEASVSHEYVNRDSGRTEFIVVNYYPY